MTEMKDFKQPIKDLRLKMEECIETLKELEKTGTEEDGRDATWAVNSRVCSGEEFRKIRDELKRGLIGRVLIGRVLKRVLIGRVHLINPRKNSRTLCGHDRTYARFQNNTPDLEKVTCKECLDNASIRKIDRKEYLEWGHQVHLINPRIKDRVMCGHDKNEEKYRNCTENVEKVTCKACYNNYKKSGKSPIRKEGLHVSAQEELRRINVGSEILV